MSQSQWMRSEWVSGGTSLGKSCLHSGVHPETLFALDVRIKALHHWIRKGDGDKARSRMLECVRQIAVMEKRLGDCGDWRRR
jgi:hypothetical protein